MVGVVVVTHMCTLLVLYKCTRLYEALEVGCLPMVDDFVEGFSGSYTEAFLNRAFAFSLSSPSCDWLVVSTCTVLPDSSHCDALAPLPLSQEPTQVFERAGPWPQETGAARWIRGTLCSRSAREKGLGIALRELCKRRPLRKHLTAAR